MYKPLFGALTALSIALTGSNSAMAQSCNVTSLQNPFGQTSSSTINWQGHYYDGGIRHLNRRAVAPGSSWGGFGGGIAFGFSGLDEEVEEMVVFNDVLAIGGSFQVAGGQIANGVATWDGSSLSPLGNGFNNRVEHLIVWNGQLVAAGQFTANGTGTTLLDHIAIYDANSDSWQPMGQGLGGGPAGFSQTMWDLSIHQGEVYAVGRFRTSGPTTLNGVARFDGNSNQWMPLGSGIGGIQNGQVLTAAHSFAGQLWVSGVFPSIDGLSVPSNYAVWNGQNWSTVATGGVTGHSLDMIEFDGDLYSLTANGFNFGSGTVRIGRFNGTNWQPVATLDSFPLRATITEDGNDIMLGGFFSSVDGVQTGNVVLLNCNTNGSTSVFCTPADGNPGNLANIDISATDLSAGTTLMLTGATPNRPGLLLIGDSNQVINMPGGSASNLCVAGGLFRRYGQDVSLTSAAGTLSVDISNSVTGGPGFGIPGTAMSITAGQTWNFQFWYRDNIVSPALLSSAIQVTFN